MLRKGDALSADIEKNGKELEILNESSTVGISSARALRIRREVFSIIYIYMRCPPAPPAAPFSAIGEQLSVDTHSCRCNIDYISVRLCIQLYSSIALALYHLQPTGRAMPSLTLDALSWSSPSETTRVFASLNSST